MANSENKYEPRKVIWRDRKHFMWFPFSFTVYELKNDRLYQQTGLLSTNYDELLLYRVVDLTLRQTLSQKIFGTGTLILKARVDANPETYLINVKNPIYVKELLSDLIEEARKRHRVVGNEFYGNNIYMEDDDCCDHDHDGMM